MLIYVYKKQELNDVERLYPFRRRVMIDDELRTLNAMKQIWSDRLTTVFAKRFRYDIDP